MLLSFSSLFLLDLPGKEIALLLALRIKKKSNQRELKEHNPNAFGIDFMRTINANNFCHESETSIDIDRLVRQQHSLQLQLCHGLALCLVCAWHINTRMQPGPQLIAWCHNASKLTELQLKYSC